MSKKQRVAKKLKATKERKVTKHEEILVDTYGKEAYEYLIDKLILDGVLKTHEMERCAREILEEEQIIE